ncbi:MAG: hypothetical protein IT161_02640 [Bryobacterales bacterium]|nr:hypothetical protein [Bryobacterales bacterium]
MRRVKRNRTVSEPPSEPRPQKATGAEAKCVVCGDPVAQLSTEELCWVCRRLKISAWREVDNQLSAPE